MQPAASPTDDQSLHPVINGNGHDATILPICAALASRVNAFLASEAPTPILKQVQTQTRIALGVIDEALQRYRYFHMSPRIRKPEVRGSS